MNTGIAVFSVGGVPLFLRFEGVDFLSHIGRQIELKISSNSVSKRGRNFHTDVVLQVRGGIAELPKEMDPLTTTVERHLLN